LQSGKIAIQVTAIDTDNQVSSLTDSVVIHKGMPTVNVPGNFHDTVAVNWVYGNSGCDSIGFVANAFDSNGTIKKYTWYLSPPFDSLHTDTVITTTPALSINQNSTFWLDGMHQFQSDTTYSAMVKVQDDDGFTATDTFYFYYGLYTSIMEFSFLKNGINGDGSHFEFMQDVSTGLDSFHIYVQPYPYLIPASNDQFYRTTIQIVITNSPSSGDTVQLNDTIKIFDSPMSIALPNNSTMWRPPSNFFSAYEGKNISQLNFYVAKRMIDLAILLVLCKVIHFI
jgi:hypothetical protein